MQEDKIKGFKIGADDYITKPFSTQELILRIQAILKRTQLNSDISSGNEQYNIGIFNFDFQNPIAYRQRQQTTTHQKRSQRLKTPVFK